MENNDVNNLSQLMKKVQDGDQAAYTELFNTIGPKVFRVIRSRIRDPHVAEELYQTVFMTIHRARHTFDPSRTFEPWLFSITRNTIYDYLRKHRKQIELETLVGEHFEAVAETDTSTEEKQLLEKALKTLPDNQKTAVELIKLKGFSIKEAANQEGVSETAMKVRAHRGYEALKKYLIEQSKEHL